MLRKAFKTLMLRNYIRTTQLFNSQNFLIADALLQLLYKQTDKIEIK